MSDRTGTYQTRTGATERRHACRLAWEPSRRVLAGCRSKDRIGDASVVAHSRKNDVKRRGFSAVNAPCQEDRWRRVRVRGWKPPAEPSLSNPSVQRSDQAADQHVPAVDQHEEQHL